jgi:hypothetical protein
VAARDGAPWYVEESSFSAQDEPLEQQPRRAQARRGGE